MNNYPIFILGAGKVGTTLAIALNKAGWPILGLWSRSKETAIKCTELSGLKCDYNALPSQIALAKVIILAVVDPAIPQVANELVEYGLLSHEQTVLHCAGSKPTSIFLGHIAHALRAMGMFHPLLAIADPPRAASRLSEAYFALEGDIEAQNVGQLIANGLKSRCISLKSRDLPLYHTAAVMASNQAIGLWYAAQQVLQQTGIEPNVALAALLPLISSTLDNLKSLGIPQALTGPVRRGDTQTVSDHLQALSRAVPQWLKLYKCGTESAIQVAKLLHEPQIASALNEISEIIHS